MTVTTRNQIGLINTDISFLADTNPTFRNKSYTFRLLIRIRDSMGLTVSGDQAIIQTLKSGNE